MCSHVVLKVKLFFLILGAMSNLENVLKCTKPCRGLKFDLVPFDGPRSHFYVNHEETGSY